MGKNVLVCCFWAFLFGFIGCASAPQAETVPVEKAEPVYTGISIEDLENYSSSTKTGDDYFIVEAYIKINSPGYLDLFSLYENDKYGGIRVPVDNRDYNRKESSNERLEAGKKYTIFLGTPYFSNGKTIFEVTRIEGLLTFEEVAARKAEVEVEKKRLQVEADKYDPTKFILVPSDFKPSAYNQKDLFSAVAEMERAARGDGSGMWAIFNTRGYISDVTFVTQDGTNIVFKTDDGAITQLMKISSRSGLSAGQKVRLYYNALKNPVMEFTVIAIERR